MAKSITTEVLDEGMSHADLLRRFGEILYRQGCIAGACAASDIIAEKMGKERGYLLDWDDMKENAQTIHLEWQPYGRDYRMLTLMGQEGENVDLIALPEEILKKYD